MLCFEIKNCIKLAKILNKLQFLFVSRELSLHCRDCFMNIKEDFLLKTFAMR